MCRDVTCTVGQAEMGIDRVNGSFASLVPGTLGGSLGRFAGNEVDKEVF